MSGNREWWEFHLTPKGWIKGSESLAAGAKERPIPSDRMLTIRQNEQPSSAVAPAQTWSSIVWRHSNTRAIAALREQFGTLPPGSERYPFRGAAVS